MIRRHPVTHQTRAKVIELRLGPVCARHRQLLRLAEEAEVVLATGLNVDDVLAIRPMAPEEAAALLDRNREILQDVVEVAAREMLKDCIESDEALK